MLPRIAGEFLSPTTSPAPRVPPVPSYGASTDVSDRPRPTMPYIFRSMSLRSLLVAGRATSTSPRSTISSSLASRECPTPLCG